ncbi:MAG: calcium-binding protein [Herbaspirillum sp.]
MLESFKTAANLADLATRLVIPIEFAVVTGAKIISAHGYDAYKITIAVKSGDLNAVAKEIFSAGVGLMATNATGMLFRPLFSTGPIGAGFAVGVPIISGVWASDYAGVIWDNTLQHTAAGQWSIGQLTDSFGISLKITQGSPGNTASHADMPPANQTPDTALVLDPVSNQAGIVFRDKTRPATGNSKLYDVTSVTVTHGPLAGQTLSTTTNTQTGEINHHWLEADGSQSKGNVAANGDVAFFDRDGGALHIYKGSDYVGSFGFDHVSEQVNGVPGRYTYDPATVKDWYADSTDNRIELIETADGLTLYHTDTEQLVQAMAAFAPPAAAQTSWMRPQDAGSRILLATLH